jgi:hypothetical protein
MSTITPTNEQDTLFPLSQVRKEFSERFGVNNMPSEATLLRYRSGVLVGPRKIRVRMRSGKMLFPLGAIGISYNMFQEFGAELQKVYEEDDRIAESNQG